MLEHTLAALRLAGFDTPRLFVDGSRVEDYPHYEVTIRAQRILPFGNWWLALQELLIRHPEAERYAIFQDDALAVKNLKPYLDALPWPSDGYFNLYVHPDNKDRAALKGWNLSDQCGKGAVALAFSREAALALASSRGMAERPAHPTRGWRFIDGGVADAMKKAGFCEYVHCPSLVKHVGEVSTFSKAERATVSDALSPYRWPNGRYEGAGFPGNDYDAMELLK